MTATDPPHPTAASPVLTEREVALARVLLAADPAWWSCPALATAAEVPPRTARHVLARMADQGVVEWQPAHPGPRYRVADREAVVARVNRAVEVLGLD